MTMPQPWFRFYSEMLSDRKIEYLYRTLQQPKALVIGVWSTVLALANDSPVRGVLLLTEDISVTIDDLARETGLDVDAMTEFVSEFKRLKMLDIQNGAFCLLNWDKRQFTSDNSTERVRRWRESQAKDECPPEADSQESNGQEGETGNVVETLQDRCGNGPDTEADTETEADAEKKHAGADAPPPSKTPEPGSKKALTAELEVFFAETTGLVRPATETKTQCKAANRLWWTPLLEIAALVDSDADRAKNLIHHTVGVMDGAKDGQGLTISSPASILTTAKSEQAKRKRGAGSNTRASPTLPMSQSLAAVQQVIAQERAKNGDP
jgi:hypothetical protein